jgi:hypothetical protein
MTPIAPGMFSSASAFSWSVAVVSRPGRFSASMCASLICGEMP